MYGIEIDEKSKWLGEQIQLKKELTEHFLTEVARADSSTGVVLSILAEIIKEYSMSHGIRPEEFAKDIAIDVELMAKYWF